MQTEIVKDKRKNVHLAETFPILLTRIDLVQVHINSNFGCCCSHQELKSSIIPRNSAHLLGFVDKSIGVRFVGFVEHLKICTEVWSLMLQSVQVGLFVLSILSR